MSVTTSSPFRHAPRIGRAKWHAILDASGTYQTILWAGIPFEDQRSVADAIYDRIVAKGHDPAVWLAIAVCEHSLGVNRASVLWRNDTRSWTNARSVRDPALSGWKVITDSERGSQYVKYHVVTDSVLDGLYRVDEAGYAYRRANAVSIIDHTMIWTEGDGPQYAAKMVDLINEWTNEEPTMAAQIPGFTWVPADSNHYQPGRTEKIRGGAQHYTAGTNSLAWLSTTAGTQVSATFLVKHNPTLDERGWQLVKIEDTAWTTAFANPYTVSIEYEHDGKQTIPDIAYEVLAQTWADITRYVRQHNLGDIDTIAGHKTWVNNPSLVCPDGIDIGRIVTRWNALMKEGSAPPATDDRFTFPETGKTMGGGFYAYWKAYGGVPVFGFPITEEIVENGRTVQYTERARFEHHPEDGDPAKWHVMLGLVSVELRAALARIAELEAA